MSIDAADIIFKLAETYEKCTSYQDRGIVRHFEGEGGEGEVFRHRVAFKTVYRAADKDCPLQYYFEWVEPPVGDPATAAYRASAFWTQDNKVMRLFHSQPGADVAPSLDYAIAACAGISKGASVTVAAYLLPSLRQKMRTLFRFKELNRQEDALVDGRMCYLLKGQNWNGSEEELYIDQADNLLRRSRVAFVIKPGVDEAQLAAIQKIDPKQAEEYRKFRESQTEVRRFYNQIDYHEASVNEPLATAEFLKFDPQAKSDLIPSFAVL